jgi:RNA polymerase sigma factor (sigma-70 family)
MHGVVGSFRGVDEVPGRDVAADAYRAHAAELLAFLRARLGSDDEARDVAQETFLRLTQAATSEAIENPRAFLFQAAANLAIDRQRRAQRWRMVEADETTLDQPGTVTPERIVAARQALRDVERLIAELPPTCRTVFLLLRTEDLGYTEIARRLGISESMVRKHAARALLYLRARLDQEGGSR